MANKREIMTNLKEEIEQEFKDITEKEIRAVAEEGLKTSIMKRNTILKQKVANMFLSGMHTNKQIAEVLNVCSSTISQILKDDDVRMFITESQSAEDEIIKQSMKALRKTAIEKQRELILNADDESVSAMMIKDVLDRTGHKPVDKKEINMSHSFEENLDQLIEGIEFSATDDGIYTEIIEDDK